MKVSSIDFRITNLDIVMLSLLSESSEVVTDA
ncbi:Uncharacterised protein [Vibrio cholerae]|nr:Uncharacterised protein [Vibrio cholerae]